MFSALAAFSCSGCLLLDPIPDLAPTIDPSDASDAARDASDAEYASAEASDAADGLAGDGSGSTRPGDGDGISDGAGVEGGDAEDAADSQYDASEAAADVSDGPGDSADVNDAAADVSEDAGTDANDADSERIPPNDSRPMDDSDVAPELVLWLDSSKGLGSANAGSDAGKMLVQQWEDQSTHHNDAHIDDASLAPEYVLNAINGLPAVRFDGIHQQYLVVRDSSSLQWQSGEYTVLVVAAYKNEPASNSDDGYGAMFVKEPSAGSNPGVGLFGNDATSSTSTIRAQIDIDTYVVSARSKWNDGAFHVFGMHRRGSVLEVRADGAVEGSRDDADGDVSAPGIDVYIGGRVEGFAQQRLDGEIAEVIALRGPLSEAAIELLEASLRDKYALPKPPPLVDGLVAYYRGDGRDLSGNGHDGVVHGNVSLVPDRFDNLDLAAAFDGDSGNYIEVPNNPLLPTGSQPRTVSVWFLTNHSWKGAVQAGSLWNWGSSFGTSDHQRFGLLIDQANHASFEGEPDLVEGRGVVTDGMWHNVTVTYDGTIVSIYADGVRAGTDTPPLETIGQVLEIGRPPAMHSPEPFFGFIDKLRIYNRVLTADEIAGLSLEGNSP